jgi:uncharacterized protein DUF5130
MAAGELTRAEAGAPDAARQNAGHLEGEPQAIAAYHGQRDGHRPVVADDLPVGSVITSSGRVSTALEYREDAPPATPFSATQLARLDEAITLVSRHTQLRFSVYLGDLGDESHQGAMHLHDQLGAVAADSVLVAVDPSQRNVDIVTGAEARVRLADRSCKLAVMSMVASFKEGDLLGGLLSGLRMLSDQAGQPHRS